MQFSKIFVDGFGVLSQLEIDQLSSGLNVVYGTNGAGKTTILEFLRGMVCNFERARRLRLLPPLKGGHPGGGLEVKVGSDFYDILRHARPGHEDTLAIRTQHGDKESAPRIRQWLGKCDSDLVNTVFFVSGPESHSIQEMLRIAIRDGIDLQTQRKQATWIAEKINTVELERKDLFGPQPSRTNIEAIEKRQGQVALLLEKEIKQHQLRDTQWHANITQSTRDLSRLRAEANWLNAELQLVQSDLTEVNDRLWSHRERIVEEQQIVERSEPVRDLNWVAEIEEIDRQIAHAQQVLRDLASSRLQLTLASTELTGTDTPEQEIVFERQRSAITAIERQTQLLGKVLAELGDAENFSKCVCQDLQGQLSTSLKSIQQQIALMCQELSRQQSASEQLMLISQRDGVDQCELELTRQIQSLRLKRDELIHGSGRTTDERIQFRTKHELEHCNCDDHAHYIDGLSISKPTPHVTQDVVTTSKVVTISNARPGDRELQAQLQERKHQLQQQWQETLQKQRNAQIRLLELKQLPGQFANDDSVMKLRHEQAGLEQKLADAREQWQSLAVLQTVLQRTQEKLKVETASPVIEEASALLKKMTRGRYTAFRFNTQLEELVVTNENATDLPIHALSRGTLEQAALSFRLSLWNEYRRRGIELPLILDEVLADSDEHRLSAAIETLVEFSAKHHQLIILTCQEHLANLFERSGVSIQNLPGSRRTKKSVNRLLTLPQAEAAPDSKEIVAQETGTDESLTEDDNESFVQLDRIQPDEPFWLQTMSPIGQIPSIGEQMSRRVGSIGVRTIADLIDLDPENTEIPLDSLQISAKTLRQWQAEGRLLCCVPDLTGRDAQLLIACGILSPSELAQADADDLFRKAMQLRDSSREYGFLPWLNERSNWPDKTHFQNWVRSGQRARSYRAAHDWSVNRRRRDGSHRTPVSHLSGRKTQLSERRTSGSSRHTQGSQAVHAARVDTRQAVKIHSVLESETQEVELRFFLNMSSPIVDAPSIGARTAERFEKIGVMTVSDFINRDTEEMSGRLKSRRLTPDVLHEWQQQAILVCRIPELRGHDAQVLIACGFTDVDEISSTTPTEIFKTVSPFVNSTKGQRLLRSAKTPDLEEVTSWINYAQRSRSLRAA